MWVRRLAEMLDQDVGAEACRDAGPRCGCRGLQRCWTKTWVWKLAEMLEHSETGLASSMMSTHWFWPQTLRGRVHSLPVSNARVHWNGSAGVEWRQQPVLEIQTPTLTFAESMGEPLAFPCLLRGDGQSFGAGARRCSGAAKPCSNLQPLPRNTKQPLALV